MNRIDKVIDFSNIKLVIDKNNKSFNCKFSHEILTFINWSYELTRVSERDKLRITGGV